MAKYESKFYASRHSNTQYSAETIIDLVNSWVAPKSIIDVGCGVGTWLEAFKKKGAEKVLGIEGKWVNEENVLLEKNEFVRTNLEEVFDANESFDLTISLEVAEHITPESADNFVKTLTSHAPVVLFSAAIPLQGGKHHVNEQWPDYWREKFKNQGFVILDCIRPEIWEDDQVEMWYAQNTFLYVKESKLNDYPELVSRYDKNPKMLSAVLPRFYEFKLNRWPIMKAVKNKIKRSF